VKDGKPAPDGYLLGRERLGVSSPTDRVVVFEDAAPGVVSGKTAGAEVIAILAGTYSKEALISAGADHIIDGLQRVQVIAGSEGRILIQINDSVISH
jgi:beta-phosphoglucomutase-like phosphatase (HAD superfamily)